MPEVMVFAGKPSSKSLGKRPARNSLLPPSKQALSDYTLSRESSGLNGDVEDCSAPPSVDSSSGSPAKNQKRVLPPRLRRGGPEAAVGVGEVDLSILDLLRRKGESDPLIPRKTVFVLTTDSKFVSTASTSEIGLNRCANERFFDRPEVIRAFKEQQDIQIPEFTQVPDHEMVSSKLRVRTGGMVDMDFSDAVYEKRHRRHELAEKRQRLREKEQLEYEHYRLKSRIDQLRTMDSNIFLTLSDEMFGMADTFAEEEANCSPFSNETNGTLSEGEKRRQTMLRAAEILELRYRTLLLDKRLPKKDKALESASAPPEREIPIEGLGHAEETIVEPEANSSILITTVNTKSSRRKQNKHRDNISTVPLPSARSNLVNHSEQEIPEHHTELEPHTIITSNHQTPPNTGIQLDEMEENRMDRLQERPREIDASRGNNDNPPPYYESTAASEPALLNQTHPVIESVSGKQSQSCPKRSHRKKQKLELNNVHFLGEQGHIRIDDLPEFSPTSAFPAHEFFPDPKDSSATPREQTEESTSPEQASLVAQMENVTISAQEDSISRPPRRRGRPPKPKLIESSADKPAIKQQPKSHMVESITVSSLVVDDMARTPLSVYEPITGPGRRPFVPCIVAASRHNADYGRKSGRSVKAFGAEVPPLDEREIDFEVPSDIIEQVEDARDGPGARGDPLPNSMGNSNHIWSHDPSASTRG